VDAKTGKALAAKIVYERLPDGTDLGIAQSEPGRGSYEISLPGGQIYGIRAEADNYISESQTIDLRNLAADTKINANFTLQPIQVVPIAENAIVTLNTIFFDFDKSVVKPAAFPELERIVKMMKDRPAMSIEIGGHTDSIGTDEYNLKLSDRRANAVVKFLLSKGVDTIRITAVGYGEKKPRASNAKEVGGRAVNRRVEFKILKL
jgi:OmpA-OmpF porin, OOP family